MFADPVQGYRISDQDVAGDPKYYGYLNSSGRWYIMEENTAAGTFRYCQGRDDYATAVTGAWVIRATLTYVTFTEAF